RGRGDVAEQGTAGESPSSAGSRVPGRLLSGDRYGRCAREGAVSPATGAGKLMSTPSSQPAEICREVQRLLLVCAMATAGCQGESTGPTSRPAKHEDKTAVPNSQPVLPGAFVDVTPDNAIAAKYGNGEEADHYSILESLGGGVAL